VEDLSPADILLGSSSSLYLLLPLSLSSSSSVEDLSNADVLLGPSSSLSIFLFLSC